MTMTVADLQGRRSRSGSLATAPRRPASPLAPPAVRIAAAATDQTKTIATAGMEISNVDFRRGSHGEGRIIVTFNGQGAGVDLQRVGDKVSIDVYNAKLPAQLAQRLDVLDFATPVKFIE